MWCSRSLNLLIVLAFASGCSRPPAEITPGVPWYPLDGPLIPAHMTMVAAWDIPRNPLTDPALDNSRLSEDIRLGYRIFTNTPGEAGRLTPSRVSCANCHLNAGQRNRALPIVGIAGQFPEYNRRAGRLITLTDRILDCFLRSENATGRGEEAALPSPTDHEVLALAAYITWLSRGYELGSNPTWRNRNTIPAEALIPVDKLDPKRGEAIFLERCTSCHGEDGQGVQVGDKKPGPLWGPYSWNDGAGAARVYTLAGIIRHMMPYLDPGSLSDEEAQLVAAFINSKPRPAYPYKDRDYTTEPLPVDSVYYPPRPQASNRGPRSN
jgi:thiosulfate dehydrogenase